MNYYRQSQNSVKDRFVTAVARFSREFGFYAFLGLFYLLFQPLEAVIERELLITGCARSGTTYISNLLKASGLDVPHEYDASGTYGICSWLLTPDAQSAPWGPLRSDYHFQHIFHQVRHPLKVISSVYTTEPELSWIFIIENVPQIKWEDSHTVKTAKYWYYWNRMAEELAEWTYKIEEIEQLWTEFGDRLGVVLDPQIIQSIPTNTNTRGAHTREFTWDTLREELDPQLYADIVSLAIRYGYEDCP